MPVAIETRHIEAILALAGRRRAHRGFRVNSDRGPVILDLALIRHPKNEAHSLSAFAGKWPTDFLSFDHKYPQNIAGID